MSTPDLLIFGGTRGTGAALVRQAAADGLKVVALGRQCGLDPLPTGASFHQVDALDAAAVRQVFAEITPQTNVDVISTLGGGVPGQSADALGNIHVIEAARQAGLSRLVLITSLGCGDSRIHASERLLAAIGDTLLEKTQAEEALAKSGLDYTILRPGRLLDGPITHGAILCPDPSLHGNINREELARITLTTLRNPAAIGQTWSIVDPDQPAPD